MKIQIQLVKHLAALVHNTSNSVESIISETLMFVKYDSI